ncbi:hypothetical protein M1403_02630 [Patescibacteria group bacterium]|nr:hypothetical protein [Patescibacteria group bacterium]
MKEKRGNILVIIPILVILLTIAAGYLYFQKQETKPASQVVQKTAKNTPGETASNSAKFPPSPVPPVNPNKDPLSLYTTDYLKRQFPPNKFMGLENYPQEITSVKESDLVGLKCSPYYNKDWNGIWYRSGDGKKLADGSQETSAFFQKLQSFSEILIKKPIESNFQLCETEDGRQLVLHDNHLGLVKADITFVPVTTLSDPGDPYFVCPNPIQLTKSDLFYYECGSGDGGAAYGFLFRIDLNQKTSQLIRKCQTLDAQLTGSERETKCE